MQRCHHTTRGDLIAREWTFYFHSIKIYSQLRPKLACTLTVLKEHFELRAHLNWFNCLFFSNFTQCESGRLFFLNRSFHESFDTFL